MSAPTRTSPAAFLKLSADVASFYGFRPVRDIEKTLVDRTAHLLNDKVEKTRGLHSFATAAMLGGTMATFRPNEPILTFYATPSPLFVPSRMQAREVGEFGLQVVGTPEGVGEVMLLKTVATILNEWGVPLKKIRVNALGDRDSQNRFAREASLHARKHYEKLEPEHRAEVAHNPLALYLSACENCRAVAEEGPRPMHFLSEKSRTHFRSVLEYLEKLGFPYELDELLISDERGAHVSFALDIEGDDATVLGAFGGRYDDYFKREAHRKDTTGVAASMYFRKKGSSASNFSSLSGARKPKVYFAQLGTRAKLQGLAVLDMLRHAKVPVLQSFGASHLSVQLEAARKGGVSHLLIMGQREALDGTIIVRSMQNSVQHIVSVTEIPRLLKTLRK